MTLARPLLGLRPAEAEDPADAPSTIPRTGSGGRMVPLPRFSGEESCRADPPPHGAGAEPREARWSAQGATDPGQPPSERVLSPAEVETTVQEGFLFLHGALLHRASLGADVFAGVARRGSGGEASGRRRGRGEAAYRQRAAPALEVARRLGGAAGVAARPRSDARHRQRHLRPGSFRQIRPRLPDDHDHRLVPVAV